MCDKELEGCGGGVKEEEEGGGGVWGCCSKRYGFPSSPQACGHTQICRVKRMLSHIPPHSLFFFLMDKKSQSYTHRKKKVWLCSFTLWQETLRQSQGKTETLYSSYFLPQTFSACQGKERASKLIPLWTDNTIILTQGLLIPQVLWTLLRYNM